MATTILQPATIAHIVWMQPNWLLDCSDLNVSLFTAYQEFSGRVQTLQLVSSSPSQLMLECAFQGTTHRQYLTNTDRTYFAFHIVDDTPAENPILQAVPSAYLFHAHNKLGLNKQVPVDPPYLCTQEETHNLLLLAMSDWAPALIQQFPARLKVHHPLNWPAKEHNPAYFKAYSLEGPATKAQQLSAGRHPLGAPEEWPCDLSRLQSIIALTSVLSHVRNLCAWTNTMPNANNIPSTVAPSSDEALQLFLQDFTGLTQLWALPTASPTDVLNLTQEQVALSIDDFLPEDFYNNPKPFNHSAIGQIIHTIRSEIHQAQAIALFC